MDRARPPRIRRSPARRLHAALALCVAGSTLAAAGCAPPMVERDGHLVFNPRYLFILDMGPRARWQKPDQVVAALDLPEQAVVADVGAGGGYFTARFAQAVPQGRVYATDVQEEMITALQRRVEEEELRNVAIVRGAFDDPALPAACCDLAFLSSVYKEIDGRVGYARRLRRALRVGGRVAILEFHPDSGGPGPPREVRLPPEQVVEEMDEAGFTLVACHDFVPHEYFLVFAPREEARAPDAGPGCGA